jgi:hypothetical protein
MFRETYCSDDSEMAEVNIHPVNPRAFNRWAEKNEDFCHPLQYEGKTLTFNNNMKRPHNATGNLIVSHIVEKVEELIGERAEVATYTGRTHTFTLLFLISVTALEGIPVPCSKLADASVYSGQSGRGTFFPGVVVEVGFSDLLSKSHRDASLWINFSRLQVVASTCVIDL